MLLLEFVLTDPPTEQQLKVQITTILTVPGMLSGNNLHDALEGTTDPVYVPDGRNAIRLGFLQFLTVEFVTLRDVIELSLQVL